MKRFGNKVNFVVANTGQKGVRFYVPMYDDDGTCAGVLITAAVPSSLTSPPSTVQNDRRKSRRRTEGIIQNAKKRPIPV